MRKIILFVFIIIFFQSNSFAEVTSISLGNGNFVKGANNEWKKEEPDKAQLKLQLMVTKNDRFALSKEKNITLKITNISKNIQEVAWTNVEIQGIDKKSKKSVFFKPIVILKEVSGRKEIKHLGRGESLTTSVNMDSFFIFEKPMVVIINAYYNYPDGKAINSNLLEVQITEK